jgi:hypothetical protein
MRGVVQTVAVDEPKSTGRKSRRAEGVLELDVV